MGEGAQLYLVHIVHTNNPTTSPNLNNAIDSRSYARLRLYIQHTNVHTLTRENQHVIYMTVQRILG